MSYILFENKTNRTIKGLRTPKRAIYCVLLPQECNTLLEMKHSTPRHINVPTLCLKKH